MSLDPEKYSVNSCTSTITMYVEEATVENQELCTINCTVQYIHAKYRSVLLCT